MCGGLAFEFRKNPEQPTGAQGNVVSSTGGVPFLRFFYIFLSLLLLLESSQQQRFVTWLSVRAPFSPLGRARAIFEPHTGS